MSRWLLCLVLALAIAPAAAASGAPAEPHAAPAASLAPTAVLRLHIVANSTSDADLAAKLAVRDALIAYLTPRLSGVRSAAGAEETLRPMTSSLSRLATRTLQGYGLAYGARVVLGTADLGQRGSPMGKVSAGRYPVLVVLLGRARGQNWWCMLFPQFCLSGRAATYGFSQGRGAPPKHISMLTPEISFVGSGKVRPGGLIWHFWQLFSGTLDSALAAR